jgi:hypothetical protein
VLLHNLANTWRVVDNFVIARQEMTANGVLISGSFDKVRECKFVEVTAKTSEGYSPAVLYDGLKFQDERLDTMNPSHAHTRPKGQQTFGPWLLYATGPGTEIKLSVRHYCHVLWDHFETLTVFMVENGAVK